MGKRTGEDDDDLLQKGTTLMPIPSLYTPNKRYVTTWTSADAIQWRMYIIPSNADYSSGMFDYTLPTDFLLQDMKIETELGNIPSGLTTSVMKVSFNLAVLQSNVDLDNLRIQLLKGTSQKRFPVSSSGVDMIGTADGWYKSEDVIAQKEFDAFNTFIVQYNSGSGFQTYFIGCQKYSAENELEITALQNLIRFDIEVYDIVRCIGEAIRPDVWEYLLRCDSTSVPYSFIGSAPENTEYKEMMLKPYLKKVESYGIVMAQDFVLDNFYFHMSTFKRLATKIQNMYSGYMRAITKNNNSQFVCNPFYEQNIKFYTSFGNEYNPVDGISYNLAYIPEVWQMIDGKRHLVSGAHADNTLFRKFMNFHEVYKNLIEGMLEIVRMEYSFSAGSPDAYTITAVASNPYPATTGASVTFTRSNTYDSFKIRLLSETLKNAKVNVTSITDAEDTTSYEYSEQGTEADNSKDMEVMFHNYTMRNGRSDIYSKTSGGDVEWISDKRWIRKTINPGTLLYGDNNLETAGIFGQPSYPIKVANKVRIRFGAENLDIDYQLPTPWINAPELAILLEQQNGGLGTGIAESLVYFYGRRTQSDAELKTRFEIFKSADVGKRCIVNLADYNPLLEPIYSANTARAIVYEYSHDVYSGMAEIKLRIDGESA